MANEVKRLKILIVDDMALNITILVETLQENYDTRYAKTGKQALSLVESDPPDLILLDILMPGIDGYEVCRRLKAGPKTRNIPVIFITSLDEAEDEKKGFAVGATDYITKPFRPAIVKARVQTHLELIQRKHLLEDLVEKRTRELKATQREIVGRLGRASEFRDNETGQHIKRLSNYCALFGNELGMQEAELNLFRHASSMHDVGKLAIPDNILLKPGKLAPDEWKVMKTHTTIGAGLLDGSESKLLNLAKTIALTHHEKWNGTGYPNGLKGDDIPIEGRITAICDVFDALTSERPYKKAWTTADAVEEIKISGSEHFDQDLVDLFEKLLPKILILKKQFPE